MTAVCEVIASWVIRYLSNIVPKEANEHQTVDANNYQCLQRVLKYLHNSLDKHTLHNTTECKSTTCTHKLLIHSNSNGLSQNVIGETLSGPTWYVPALSDNECMHHVWEVDCIRRYYLVSGELLQLILTSTNNLSKTKNVFFVCFVTHAVQNLKKTIMVLIYASWCPNPSGIGCLIVV